MGAMKPVVVTTQFPDAMVHIRASENVNVETKRGDDSHDSLSLYNAQKQSSHHQIINIERANLTMNVSNIPPANEGIDHYKKLFSFSKSNCPIISVAQRKVEYENFRFKHPSLLAVVIESINVKVIDN
jgi:hypothetical protein